MLVACWSVKGGSGTTVVAAALGMMLASAGPRGATLVDLGGDLPAALGVPEPEGPGVAQWLDAGAGVAADALRRLETEVGGGLALVARGGGPMPDAGGGDGHAGLSLLVLRPCYLALRRALAAPLRPSGVVLVTERERSLGRRDVEDVLGVPVRAEVAWDPVVARRVDAGLLAGNLPRTLERALRRAA